MRFIHRLLPLILVLLGANQVASQNSCISTGVNGTVIELPCGVTCTPMTFQVPHLKSTSDYQVVDIPYNPFPFITPGGTEVTSIYIDDEFSIVYNLPFPFCFYDSLFTQFVIGSNGVVTFDLSNANCSNAWNLEGPGSGSVPIPFVGSGGCSDAFGPKYPKFSIMSPMHDINPNVMTSPNRKIEWRVIGTAPCRQLIVTFNDIPLFGQSSKLNTSQVVMYENTGIIDIHVKEKTIDTDGSVWNGNFAIMGIQKDATKALAVPGKNGTVFSIVDSSYRFIPSGPISRFVKAELTDITGTVLATTGIDAGSDTSTTTPGLLDVTFPQQCPTAASTQYVVKTYYASCSDPNAQVVANDTITVNNTTSLQATHSTIPAACGPNGIITVDIPTGAGTLPYSLSIDGGAPVTTSNQTYTFTGLISGDHTIQITTDDGCAQTIIANVGTSGVLNINTTPTAPSCNGASNGSISVSPINGVAPFQYQINNGAWVSTNTFNNLPSGNYFIGVKDNSGCIVQNVLTIIPTGPPITVTPTATPPSCNGATNGSITISPNSGTAPYQYSINGGAWTSSATFNNLPTGSYFISIVDALGCYVNNLSVSVPASTGSLTATVTSNSTSCSGVNNGSINIVPTSGSGPYQYSLDGAAFVTGTSITGLAPGTYTVVVKDGAGCSSAPIAVTVEEGGALQATATPTATSCSGVSNGTITVTPTNGSGPYTYQLDGGSQQTSNIFTNVSSGYHEIIVADAAGCVSFYIPVMVGVGPALTGTTASTATSCNGASDGTITVTPTNGVAPYLYSIDGGVYQASNTFTGVTPGQHNITIQDAVGCVSASYEVDIANGPALTATVATTPTSCSGATNGTVEVTPTSGSGTFEYSIDGTNFQSSNTFTGLATGPYTITYRNNLGCQGTIPVTIEPGQPLSATVATNNVLCNGGNSGNVTVTISTNGAPPYEYSLDGTTWQPSNIFNGLVAGNYTVYFRDNNNCSGSEDFVITEPAALTITPAEQSALCYGQSNGVIMIAANGGTAPYEYSIDGTTYQSSNSFSVIAGTYNITVRDANDCIQTASVTVDEPAELTASSITSNSGCLGNDGNITVSANGGTTNYSYSIDGTTFQSSNIFTTGPGNYTVITKDANGCTTSENVVVGLTDNLTISPLADATICEGASVKLEPTSNGAQFSWSPQIELSDPNALQPTASPTTTIEYTLTSTLGVCTTTESVTINVLPAPIPDAGPDVNICFGQDAQLAASGGVSYQWSPSDYLNSNIVPNPSVTPVESIQYSLHVIGANGCSSLIPDVVNVNVTPPIEILISNDTIVAMGDVFQLHASSVATDYTWTPPFGLDNPNKADPMVTVTGDITYTVEGTTSAGCRGEASVTLKVYEGPQIYVPTAFTPNGDGRNDVFKPFPVGIKYYTYFRVYNRWGQLIYATTQFNRGWDGKIAGKEQPTGTYIWMVEGITKDDRKLAKKGTVTLIR